MADSQVAVEVLVDIAHLLALQAVIAFLKTHYLYQYRLTQLQ